MEINELKSDPDMLYMGKKKKKKKKLAIIITSVVVTVVLILIALVPTVTYFALMLDGDAMMPNGFFIDTLRDEADVVGCKNGKTATEIEIPDSALGKPVTNVHLIMVKGNTSLTTLSIPYSVNTLQEDLRAKSRRYCALGSCTSLEYNIYENGCYLGDEEHPYSVFVKPVRDDLETITLHKETKIIYSYAFEKCDSRYILLQEQNQ